jgi:hypothetical protein
MVMLYEGCLKKLTTTRYPIYPVISYSVSHTGYIVGYVVLGSIMFCRGPVFQSSHSLVSHLSRQIIEIARFRSVPECVSKREVKKLYVCTMRGKRKESCVNHESKEHNEYLFGKCMCQWRGERSPRRSGGVKTSADRGINVSILKCVIDALCMSQVAKPYLGVVKINPRLADLLPKWTVLIGWHIRTYHLNHPLYVCWNEHFDMCVLFLY